MNDEAVCRTAPATPGLLIIKKGTDTHKDGQILRLIGQISLLPNTAKIGFTLFTESAHWADSVIESPCPSVYLCSCVSVRDNSKEPLPEVV